MIPGRDGNRCFYCPNTIPAGLETIEHLVPAAAGGPNHLANLFLAHRSCNEAAGTVSAVEKIRLRERHYIQLYYVIGPGSTATISLAEVIEDLAAIADTYSDDERNARWLSNIDFMLIRLRHTGAKS